MTLLVAVVSGFAGGVFVRSLFCESWWPIIFTLLIAGLCGGFSFLRPRRVYSLVAVFFVFVAFGMMRAGFAEEPLPSSFASEVKRRVSYEGVVVADPDVRDANQRTHIRVSSAGESTTMLAVAPRYPTVAVGDNVFVSGTLAVPEPFADDNGRIFRYDKYLERDGVRFILNFAYIRVESPAPWYSIPATFARVKHAFIDGIRAALPEPHASLASGIVIGGKSGLGNELKEDFIRSGLVHIIVLSGYNVMVVAEWIIAAFALTKLPKRWGAFAGALALLIFVGIAGATATSIRAAVMALIALYARSNRTHLCGGSRASCGHIPYAPL